MIRPPIDLVIISLISTLKHSFDMEGCGLTRGVLQYYCLKFSFSGIEYVSIGAMECFVSFLQLQLLYSKLFSPPLHTVGQPQPGLAYPPASYQSSIVAQPPPPDNQPGQGGQPPPGYQPGQSGQPAPGYQPGQGGQPPLPPGYQPGLGGQPGYQQPGIPGFPSANVQSALANNLPSREVS